jgi:hypothetical protein
VVVVGVDGRDGVGVVVVVVVPPLCCALAE